MEKINWLYCPFTFKGIMPETGDIVTTLWGRKYVRDIQNAIGIIGTALVQAPNPTVIPIKFSEMFHFPPAFDFLIKPYGSGTYQSLKCGHYSNQQIHYWYNSDAIILYSGMNSNDLTTVIFRVHGV
jgi:hypothetical protein